MPKDNANNKSDDDDGTVLQKMFELKNIAIVMCPTELSVVDGHVRVEHLQNEFAAPGPADEKTQVYPRPETYDRNALARMCKSKVHNTSPTKFFIVALASSTCDFSRKPDQRYDFEQAQRAENLAREHLDVRGTVPDAGLQGDDTRRHGERTR